MLSMIVGAHPAACCVGCLSTTTAPIGCESARICRPDITRYEQKFPVWFGKTKIYLTVTGKGVCDWTELPVGQAGDACRRDCPRQCETARRGSQASNRR